MKIQRELTPCERNRLLEDTNEMEEEINRVIEYVIKQIAYEQSFENRADFIDLSCTSNRAERIPQEFDIHSPKSLSSSSSHC